MKHIFPKLTAAACSLLLLSGCDMLESHPYDVRISGDKGLTEKNIAIIEASLRGRRTISFAMISDTQGGYDDTVDAVMAINRRGDIDFVVHGGDFTDFGATREFELQRDILAGLAVPYISVIGNHDCLATGVEAYRAVFGPLDYAFTAGDVRFLCLNTNALEFDYSVAVPDFGFLRRELSGCPPEIRKTIVLMHAAPFSEQFNNNCAQEFHDTLLRFPGLQFCLYGHGHHVEAGDLFGDGLMYYECADIKKRSFLVFHIRSDESYVYETVEF